jgi:hypothetical protein
MRFLGLSADAKLAKEGKTARGDWLVDTLSRGKTEVFPGSGLRRISDVQRDPELLGSSAKEKIFSSKTSPEI